MREATVDVADQSARFYDSANVDAPRGAHLAIDDSGAQVVRVCSFKGPPNKDQAVEIADATFPAYERQGIASAMAAQLVAIARSSREVELIVPIRSERRTPRYGSCADLVPARRRSD